MERLFHAACAVVLCVSIVAFLQGDERERLITDPRADLFSFLRANGGVIGDPVPLMNGEVVVELTLPGCANSGGLLYMPVIHRISDPARALMQGADRAVFVHDRTEVGSLTAWRIIPRWLARRLAVNFQILSEDPWISIAFALLPPKGCTWPTLDWSRVSARE